MANNNKNCEITPTSKVKYNGEKIANIIEILKMVNLVKIMNMVNTVKKRNRINILNIVKM